MANFYHAMLSIFYNNNNNNNNNNDNDNNKITFIKYISMTGHAQCAVHHRIYHKLLNKYRKRDKQQKLAIDTMHINHTKIDLAEKVVFQHAF